MGAVAVGDVPATAVWVTPLLEREGTVETGVSHGSGWSEIQSIRTCCLYDLE